MAKRKIKLPSGEVEAEIIRSRRRTISLSVQPGGKIIIRSPWYVPAATLLSFTEEKSNWIEKQLERLRHVTPPGTRLKVREGDLVPFMGMKLRVEVKYAGKRSVSREGDRLLLTLPADDAAGRVPLIHPPGRSATAGQSSTAIDNHATGQEREELLSAMTDGWYLKEAKSYLPARTHLLANRCRYLLPAPAAVGVRLMRRRWGTCHSNGRIWLNRELIKKDAELIDYVIIHELCHLVHHNHGPEFYALLGSIMPDYRDRKKRLSNN